ncbi:hypothetical protein SK128_028581, partial [Halocaridina rubra]
MPSVPDTQSPCARTSPDLLTQQPTTSGEAGPSSQGGHKVRRASSQAPTEDGKEEGVGGGGIITERAKHTESPPAVVTRCLRFCRLCLGR